MNGRGNFYHQFNKKRGKYDEQKWEKIGDFFRFTIFINSTFPLASHNASVEETTPAVSVTELVDTITIVNVTNNEGGNLNWDLEQWATFPN